MSHSSIKNKKDDFVPRPNPAVKRPTEQDDSESVKANDGSEKKLGFHLKKPGNNLSVPLVKKPISNISLQLKSAVKAANTAPTAVKPKVGKVAAAFDSESEEEEEEMPPEAKMRMKNIGRNTPTSSGPNSFGKGKMGFCDSAKVYERKLKELEDKVAND